MSAAALLAGGTPPLRFEPLDLVSFGGVDYVYVRRCETGHVMRRHGQGLEETFTDTEAAAFAGRHDYLHLRGHFAEAGAFARERSGVSSLADLVPVERSKVAWKTWWVEAFMREEAEDKAKRSDDSMQAAIDRLKAQAFGLDCARRDVEAGKRKTRAGTTRVVREAPCPRTLRNWLVVYEAAKCRPHALRDGYRHCGNHLPRIAAAVHRIVKEVAASYATEKRPTVKNLFKVLKGRIAGENETLKAQGGEPLEQPSIKALRKAIAALSVFTVYAGRHGEEAARKRFQIVKDAVLATRPGERLEMDEWTAHVHKLLVEADLWTELPEAERRKVAARLLANLVVDCASRCVLGLAIGPTATGELAKAAMRMVVLDKTAIARAAGCETPWDMRLTPELVVTDGGSGLTSEESVTTIRDLGSRHDVPPGGMPQRRPFIERLNRTVDLCFLPNFTGRTFTNSEDRGDYDAQLRASVNVDTFTLAFVRWIVDVYHNTPHEGLGGETPRNAWLRLAGLHGVIAAPGVDRRRAIFGTELERKVTLRGVRLLGLHYHDAGLAERFLRDGPFEVVIRFDEDDLSAVSLRVGDRWRRLPCRTAGLEGVSVGTWTAAAADVRRRFDDQARITEAVVLAALAAIRRMAAESEAAVGITRLAPRAETIRQIEAGLLAGFEVPSSASPPGFDDGPSGDSFDRAFETGGASAPSNAGRGAGAGGAPPSAAGVIDGLVDHDADRGDATAGDGMPSATRTDRAEQPPLDEAPVDAASPNPPAMPAGRPTSRRTFTIEE